MGHSVVMVKEALAPHAECLARAGFVVLAVDWRMVGSSEGEPRCQWLPQWQVDDLRAGVSYLRGRPEVDPERIGLWGHSTAAGVAIVAGAFDRRVRCVAGQNPSLLDTWTALETSRGRNQLTAIRTVLEQDFDRRLVIGEGVTVPALPADDPKLAGYIAQSEELFPTFGNQITWPRRLGAAGPVLGRQPAGRPDRTRRGQRAAHHLPRHRPPAHRPWPRGARPDPRSREPGVAWRRSASPR
jgi:uncharacterized protein